MQLRPLWGGPLFRQYSIGSTTIGTEINTPLLSFTSSPPLHESPQQARDPLIFPFRKRHSKGPKFLIFLKEPLSAGPIIFSKSFWNCFEGGPQESSWALRTLKRRKIVAFLTKDCFNTKSLRIVEYHSRHTHTNRHSSERAQCYCECPMLLCVL